MLPVLGLLAWATAVGAGLVRLAAFETAPGPAATAPVTWPAASTLPSPNGRPVLVMLMHPQCSCSTATIAELSRLHAHVQGKLDTYVLMLAPKDMPLDWIHSPLWSDAAAIPGVHVVNDRDGLEARRFGAFTSGQALLYDERGRLRFSGGITESRGHEGDNAGREAIEAIVTTHTATTAATYVYGCGLFAPASDIRSFKELQ